MNFTWKDLLSHKDITEGFEAFVSPNVVETVRRIFTQLEPNEIPDSFKMFALSGIRHMYWYRWTNIEQAYEWLLNLEKTDNGILAVSCRLSRATALFITIEELG